MEMCQIPLQEGTYCPKCQLTVSTYQLFHGLPKFLWVFSKTCSSSSSSQLHPYLKIDWADISIHLFLPKTGQLWSICPRALLSLWPKPYWTSMAMRCLLPKLASLLIYSACQIPSQCLLPENLAYEYDHIS